jgi:Secretion system C-terminal sorting domain/Pregnancy-associated plasma protein-A
MKALSTLLFIFILTQAGAQRICGSQEYRKQLLAKNPALQNSFDIAEKQIKTTLANSKKYAARDTSSNEIINVPVVVHVIYKNAVQNISDAQILSQLDVLNKDFSNQNTDRINTPAVFKNLSADTKIKFCLAQVDPKGKRTSGIVRRQTNIEVFSADDIMKFSASGGDDGWNSQQYLNIWVCVLSSRSLGYASLPGGPADKDGLVISYDVFGNVGTLRKAFDKGRTATHEVAHWLGLKHIWGDDDCGDDEVDDTPRQKTYNFGSPVFPHVTDCSLNANGDMFMNYMDFSDDAAMNMFTIGQKKRMRALFAKGNIRNSFLASFACDSNAVQPAPLPTPETAPATTDSFDIFKVYPNPVQNMATIEYIPAAQFGAKHISIYNSTGKNVFNTEINKTKTTINLSNLISGLYIIRIGEGKKAYSTKLIKI